MDFPHKDEFSKILKGLGRSEATVLAYSRDMHLYFSISDGISEVEVQNAIVSLTGQGYSASSIRRLLSSIRTYCSVFSIEINLSRIPKPRLSVRESFYVTDDLFSKGIVKILDDQKSTKYSPEFKAMVFDLLFKTGMRVRELLTLQKESYDSKTRSLLIIGKGDKQRRIPVSPSVSHIFEDDLFFKSLRNVPYNTVLFWAKKYFGKKCTPHSFRHGFTTKIIKNGAKQYSVKSVLGHESYTTTLRYFHMDYEEVQQEVLSALEEEM